MKQCTNCRGNLADFVATCPYCGVSQPVPQMMAQPGWGAPPQNSNKAIASLVCGVLFLCPPASVAAVVLGHLALSDIKKSAGRVAGQGLAVAGLVLGYLGVGFSALLLIAFGIGVRNAMRQSVSLNEYAAIQTMKKYNQSLKKYSQKCPRQVYPVTLEPLGPGGGDCAHANLVDAQLSEGKPIRGGYQFAYSTGAAGAERVTVFALVASPIQPGITGKRYFFLDETGVIRQSDSHIIGPRSETIGDWRSDDDND